MQKNTATGGSFHQRYKHCFHSTRKYAVHFYAIYLVGCLVVHNELAVDKVETIRFGLERMVNHVLNYIG